MIKFELWRGDTSVLHESISPEPDSTEPLSKLADRRLDALITEIHAGKYGPAPIRIVVDFYDKEGRMFLGRHAREHVEKLEGTRTKSSTT